MGLEKGTQEQLYNSRMKLKREMQRAIQCIKPSSKRKLAKEWKDIYSEIFYKELISCARNKDVKHEIANWTDERMGKPNEL